MDENNIPIPALDQLVQNRQLQMMKAIIPYMEHPTQRFLSIYLKLTELQNTIRLFQHGNNLHMSELNACQNESQENRMLQMMNDLKAYMNPEDRENIENMLNYMELFSTYGDLFQGGINPEDLFSQIT